MSFFVGLVFGMAVGALVGARSPGGLKKDVTEILGSISPETREVTEQVGDSLTERFRLAQDVYATTLQATRLRLQHEFEAARSRSG